MKQIKRLKLKPEQCDKILEALAVASVILSIFAVIEPVGVLSAPVALYCLIVKHKK